MRLEAAVRLVFSLLHLVVGGVYNMSARDMADVTQRIVDVHNFYRKSAVHNYHVANMNMLYWSEALAERARNASRCHSWEADHGPLVNAGKVSERAASSPPSSSAELIFQSWVSSPRHRGSLANRNYWVLLLDALLHSWHLQIHAFHTDSAAPLRCVTPSLCHKLKNMLNAAHRSIGCAMLSSCDVGHRSLVLHCIYDGGSSSYEKFDMKEGRNCSKCDSPFSFCHDSLCVPCLHHNRELCECRKTCHEDGVGTGVLNLDTCTCSCQYGMGVNCDEPCRNKNSQFYDETLTRRIDQCALYSEIFKDNFCLSKWERDECPAFCGVCTPWPTATALMTTEPPVPLSEIYMEEPGQGEIIETVDYPDFL